MARNWTHEQDMVLRERGNNLLVSAAAGSGKTAVMVERIIRLITEGENPPDIDRFLVVTFTNAAAASMRERIRQALEEKLQADPGNVHLQRQMTLVHQAQITTIHSFCLDVVRSHFFDLERPGGAGGKGPALDPGFRIADEGEMVLLKNEVLDQVLEDAHALEESDERIRAFFAHFAAGRDDRAAGAQILKLYEYACAYPWPERFRASLPALYRAATPEEAESAPWMEALKREILTLAGDTAATLRRLLRLTQAEGGPKGYAGSLETDLERFVSLFGEAPADDPRALAWSYETLREKVIKADTWGLIGRVKKDETDEGLKEAVAEGRNALKKLWGQLSQETFAPEMADILAMNAGISPVMEGLVRLTGDFADRFLAAKLDRGEVDFNDMEHFALQILLEEDESELRRRSAALEYAGKFLYVMTDEYQDSNLVQEQILLAVSGGDGSANRFMVGDVKQSIYRFRQARPDLFIEKMRTYRKMEETAPVIGEDHRIELHRNFRSRPQILACVNRIFRQVMGEDLGAVAYHEDAFLYPGAAFPEAEREQEPGLFAPELWLLDRSGAPEDEEDETGESSALLQAAGAPVLTAAEQEAHLAGARILELVGQFPVWDEKAGGYRKAAFRDLAVLLRSGAGWADVFAKVFADLGIPAYAGSGGGYFETLEVRTVLSFLHIIDNPRQDIHLAGVLRSPMGAFSDDELARIRSASRDCDLYTALVNDREREKTARFLDLLETLREEAAGSSVHEIIRRILDVTGYEYYVLAMPGGSQRRANLQLLLEKAMAFEQGSYRGLFNFLRYIGNIRSVNADLAEAVVTEDSADAVQIMTIHKSKGLEFPIVLVCGLGKGFNRQDQREELLLHPSLGAGLYYVDRAAHVRIPSLQRRILMQQLRGEDLGEELRVLYVALTRAREKLILTGGVSNPDKALAAWEAAGAPESELLSYVYRRGAGRFLDYLMPQTLAGGEQVPRLQVVSAEQAREMAAAAAGKRKAAKAEEASDPRQEGDGTQGALYAYLQKLEKRERYVRSLAKKARIPVTVSVSELKHPYYEQEMQQEAWQLLETETDRKPGSEAQAGAPRVGGAARGTLYHALMEHLRYTGEDPAQQLESLIKCGKIDPCAREVIDLSDIRRFLDSRTGQQMAEAYRAGTLRRETPFVIGRRARELKDEWDSDETVLVQGIIDAWFLSGGGITLLDYKTDAVGRETDPEGQSLVRKYQLQLAIYREALEALTGQSVDRVVIWSFALGKAIEL